MKNDLMNNGESSKSARKNLIDVKTFNYNGGKTMKNCAKGMMSKKDKGGQPIQKSKPADFKAKFSEKDKAGHNGKMKKK